MLKMAVGQTDELDGELAAESILGQCSKALEGANPQAGLLLASHDLDIVEFLARIGQAFPQMELIGGTTIGAMSSAAAYQEGATTLSMFASEVLDFACLPILWVLLHFPRCCPPGKWCSGSTASIQRLILSFRSTTWKRSVLSETTTWLPQEFPRRGPTTP